MSLENDLILKELTRLSKGVEKLGDDLLSIYNSY